MDATLPEKRQRLINALIAARKAKGISQFDLARELSKPQSFVAKYENAQRQLDMEEFLNICRALAANPLTLMMEAELITRDDFP